MPPNQNFPYATPFRWKSKPSRGGYFVSSGPVTERRENIGLLVCGAAAFLAHSESLAASVGRGKIKKFAISSVAEWAGHWTFACFGARISC